MAQKDEGNSRSEASGTQCIHRSFAVVRMLASGASEGEKLVDIAARLNLSHPTAHRILKALESEGIVERARGSRRYQIGAEAAWLGLAAYSRFPITRLATPTLDRLVEAIGDSVFLAVPSHNDSVYADRRFGAYPVQARRVAIGARRPLGVSVAGRAMLGFMKDERVEAVLRDNADRYGDWRCSEQQILSGAEEVRKQGFLCSDSLVNAERRVLAVPVRDVVGQPVAALSIIAARPRLGGERMSRLVPLLRDAAREISAAVHRQTMVA
ncbi:IclR family transcriptional regulator [Neotabrizicola shimadae]|uniref:IclR family transcriptional regulator n=1 Tax=Neotabrizicola shimadae TaxID=2807096 RepID=A0A8G0ZSC9_9RHOB|nr:IclR family transcriptional regulator [Neotabrizicola shimadae]QYZ69574.1 IclR family transcriptional regulator [Neotabrizicola shimadae]